MKILIIGGTGNAGRRIAQEALGRGLTAGARDARLRLLVVGGAGPLLVPGTDRLALDDPRWVPSEIRPIAAASNRQLEILREHPDTDWTYLAPAAHFAPGHWTGRYATADGELVIASDGSSIIFMEDYAIALMDLAEAPRPPHRVVAVDPAH